MYWGIWSHHQTYSEFCVTLAYTIVPYSEPWLILNSRHLQKPVKHERLSGILETWHSKKSLFKHFQGYLGLFRDIDAYSATLTGHTQLERRGEASPALFKIKEKCPDFEKKGPDYINLWVEFSIKNLVLRISRKKTPECFPKGPLFLVFLTKCLSLCPIQQTRNIQNSGIFSTLHMHSCIYRKLATSLFYKKKFYKKMSLKNSKALRKC